MNYYYLLYDFLGEKVILKSSEPLYHLCNAYPHTIVVMISDDDITDLDGIKADTVYDESR